MAEEKVMGANTQKQRYTISTGRTPLINISGESPGMMTGENSKPEKCKAEGKSINSTVSFYKLFSFADSKDIVLMIMGTVAALLNGASTPIMTVLVGKNLNAFGNNADGKHVVRVVTKVAVAFVYLGLGAFFASLFQVACWTITGERQAAQIRTLYLETILRQDISFFDNETNTGEVVGRMSGDTALIQDAIGEKVGKFIQLVSTFIGGFLIAFFKGWLLTLVMLSSIPPLVVCGAAVANVYTKMTSRAQTAYSEAGNTVEQTISAIRTVASFCGEKEAITRYVQSLTSAYKSGVQEGLATGLGIGSIMFTLFSGYGFAVWYGSRLILEKGYTGGDIINVVLAILLGAMSLGQASPCLSSFAGGRGAAFKMFETIKRKPDIDSYDTRGRVLEDICGDIQLKNVYFSYSSRPEEQIFAGFSLSIPSGTCTALVGQSGSGKSTVISLIERFYDPQIGQVLIDGINLKEFQLQWIRNKIGLVSQEPVLFSCSIRENIAYGKDGATAEEIIAASKLANAASFIDKLPQGLDTLVGEYGTQLSGGQKQRVVIARAILKDPRILLLDEATSALDSESERIVQEALERIMVNRTTLVVAHRLSTVISAESIAVIQNGKIIEKGSHSELLSIVGGAYRHLLDLEEHKGESGNHSSPDGRLSIDSGRKSSQRSSGVGNSGRQSFSDSFRVQHESKDQESVEKETKPQGKKVPLFRLAALNKPEIPVLILGTIAAVINGMIIPTFGILFSGLVKTFYEPPSELRRGARFWSLMFVLAGVVSLLVSPAKTYFFGVAGCKLIKRVRSMCFEKIVHMEVAWFDKPENFSGTIGARLSSDAANVRALVGDALALHVQNAATAIAALVIAFQGCWQVAIIVLFMFPLVGISGWIEMKFTKGFATDEKMMYEEASQVASDSVRSIRTVASFCAERKIVEMYKKKCEGPKNAGKRQGFISGVSVGLSVFLIFSFEAISFYWGAHLVQDGKTTYERVYRVYFALVIAGVGISQQTSYGPDFAKAMVSAASIFAILDQTSKIDSSDDSGTTLNEINGVIEFRNVNFTYPTRPDVQIFHDICLVVKSHKTVALVGESGCGKSTALSLLQRFYDLNSGQITLDGMDIRKFQLRWLRKQMGLVSQEPVLFNDTIRANIAYGKEGNATEAEILTAAELANAHNFISGLQQGYDTIVGERGIKLSGGQKQRVAIARAILKEPKVLLLDEATSALDVASERTVQDALDRVMVNRTSVVVAHRLSTIKNANLIAVLKNGAIIEKGKHETLMNIKDGIYASLVSLHLALSS